MNDAIRHDLLKNKPLKLQPLLDEFNRNASWAGYFFTGPEAEKLAAAGIYEKTPKQGLHATVWHEQNHAMTMDIFLRTVPVTERFDTRVLGYADDGKNQAIMVERPDVFINRTQPHISISWAKGANPAAAGMMQFGPVPEGIPSELHGGQFVFVMRNSRLMDVSAFRQGILMVERERMQEIAAKLPPEVVKELKPFDQMNWDDLKKQFISTGVQFNETLAKLYAQYLADTTDDKMPSRSDIEKQEDLEEQEALRQDDEQELDEEDDQPAIPE